MKKEVTIQFDNAKASEPQKAVLDGDFSGGGESAEFPVLDFTEVHSDWTYYRITSVDPETGAPVFEEMQGDSSFGMLFAMERDTQVAVKVPVEFATQFKSCGMMKVVVAKSPTTGTIALNYTEQLYQRLDEYNIFGTIYTSCPGLVEQMGTTKMLYATVTQTGEAYISNVMLLISGD